MPSQTEFNLKLAGKVFKAKVFFKSTKDFCQKYICQDPAEETVSVIDSDVQNEKACFPNISVESAEIFALHRKLVHSLLSHNVILFHGSAVCLDGKGYIFTAPSGTGKSTHAEKWHRLFGASYINDDKPLIKIDKKAIAYGSPWMGEHNLGENASCPMEAVFVIVRSEENHIEAVSENDAFFELIKQTYIPKDKEKANSVIKLVKSLSKLIKVYRLYCNMDDESAQIAIKGIDNK